MSGLFLTLLGSSCTKPSTTGMSAEAATALTSSSRSWRPTVMAGSTRGSNTEIRSWDTDRRRWAESELPWPSGWHYSTCITQTCRQKPSIFCANHTYLWAYGPQICYCRSLLCLFKSYRERVVPVGLPGHTWSRVGLRVEPPTDLLLAASAGRPQSLRHQFHSCGGAPRRVSGRTSPWQEPPPDKQGKTLKIREAPGQKQVPHTHHTT